MAIVPLSKARLSLFGAFTIHPDLVRLGRCGGTAAFSSAVERRGSGRTVGLSCGTRASLPETRAGETGGFLVLLVAVGYLAGVAVTVGDLRMTLFVRWCWSKMARIYIFCALWCADFSELRRM